MASEQQIETIWRPQPGPQTALIKCPVFEVLYGGARGGGKTDAMLGEWIGHASTYGADAIGLFVRRTLVQLGEAIERAKQIYGPLGFVWREQQKSFTSPNGARLMFRYLERDSDAENYQGHSYTRLYVEELSNFPDAAPIRKMTATLRSGSGVPVGFRATANPGGPGHHWVKERYIDPAPTGYEILRDDSTGKLRVFIPARVSDNKFLGDDYVDQLRGVGSPELVRAWLEGDWSVVVGAFFPEFAMAKHVIKPVTLPKHWTRFRSIDWGSARPFSVGWWAVSDGELPQFPRGSIIRYREWYGASEPNVGLRMVAEDVATGIREREAPSEKIDYSVADPAMWISDGGPSLAERFLSKGVIVRKADNKRIAAVGAIGGWDQVRARLVGEDDRPMIYFFETCRDAIRTLPALQHDEKRPEDVDTEGEDHAPDEIRYACMSRPYSRPLPKKPELRGHYVGKPEGVIVSQIPIGEMVRRQAENRW